MTNKIKKSEFKQLVFETICSFYQNRFRKALLKEAAKETVFDRQEIEEGAELPDSTDQILSKFPTLKHALERLQTDNFQEFVSGIDWISPKPSAFRINLKNGQSFDLTWMGKDFEANISGKRYYLGQLVGFQQALGKLAILYKEGPLGVEDEGSAGGQSPVESSGSEFSGGMSGGFPDMPEMPGAEEAAPEGGEQAPEGEEQGGEPNAKDLNVDFEADANI